MKKGFTSKELVFVLIIIAIVLSIVLPTLFGAINQNEKVEIVNYAKLYIKKLNTEIIKSRIEGEDKLYKVSLPKKKDETVTFSINNNILENPYNFEGIVKVTYVSDSKYEYKIALHSDNLMIGTIKNPEKDEEIDIKTVKKYNQDSFNNK